MIVLCVVIVSTHVVSRYIGIQQRFLWASKCRMILRQVFFTVNVIEACFVFFPPSKELDFVFDLVWFSFKITRKTNALNNYEKCNAVISFSRSPHSWSTNITSSLRLKNYISLRHSTKHLMCAWKFH